MKEIDSKTKIAYTGNLNILPDIKLNIYKSVADGCIKLQDKLGTYTKDRASIYKVKEEIKEILSQMPTSKGIKKCFLPLD